jgi:hypothetical protein
MISALLRHSAKKGKCRHELKSSCLCSVIWVPRFPREDRKATWDTSKYRKLLEDLHRYDHIQSSAHIVMAELYGIVISRAPHETL